MALFDVAELSALLGRTVDATAGALALDLATGLVEGEFGGTVEETTSEAVLAVDPSTGLVTLPGLVVTDVASVEADGVTLDDDDWEWPRPQPVLRLVAVPEDGYVTVTWTHGFSIVPPMVKAVALSVAARIIDNPTGLRAEAIDDYSATRAGSDADLAGLTLTDAERTVLSRVAGRGGARVTQGMP